MFSDGQDVKYDRDITPHPHPFHGTNSHEHSAHRDNRVNKTWKWRGRITQLISNRHVSPHVPSLSTHCCGGSTNAAATLPSQSLASRCGEHRTIIPRIFFFGCFAATKLSPHQTEFFWGKNYEVINFDLVFWPKFFGKENKKVIDFDLFFWLGDSSSSSASTHWLHRIPAPVLTDAVLTK